MLEPYFNTKAVNTGLNGPLTVDAAPVPAPNNISPFKPVNVNRLCKKVEESFISKLFA